MKSSSRARKSGFTPFEASGSTSWEWVMCKLIYAPYIELCRWIRLNLVVFKSFEYTYLERCDASMRFHFLQFRFTVIAFWFGRLQRGMLQMLSRRQFWGMDLRLVGNELNARNRSILKKCRKKMTKMKRCWVCKPNSDRSGANGEV